MSPLPARACLLCLPLLPILNPRAQYVYARSQCVRLAPIRPTLQPLRPVLLPWYVTSLNRTGVRLMQPFSHLVVLRRCLSALLANRGLKDAGLGTVTLRELLTQAFHVPQQAFVVDSRLSLPVCDQLRAHNLAQVQEIAVLLKQNIAVPFVVSSDLRPQALGHLPGFVRGRIGAGLGRVRFQEGCRSG